MFPPSGRLKNDGGPRLLVPAIADTCLTPKGREGPEGKRPVPARPRDNLLAFVIDFLCRRIALRGDRPIQLKYRKAPVRWISPKR